MFNNRKLSTKQISGFILVALIVGLVGGVGITGLTITARNFDVCVDVEVPRANASMEAIIAMISGRDMMGEYLLTENPETLTLIEKEFKANAADFHKHADYLVKNGTPEIKKMASQARAQFSLFLQNAQELMDHQRKHIASEKQSAKVMAQFDQHAQDLAKALLDYEKQLTGSSAIDPKVDAAMEAKSIMYQQKAVAEEYMGVESLAATAALRKEFKEREAEFDKLESLLPATVVKEHADYGALAAKMFEHHDQALGLKAESLEHMKAVDSYSKQAGATFEGAEELAAASMMATMARAGEAGAGFAVVADEVRSLALRAAEAAKGTQTLIEANIKNIKESAELVSATDQAFTEVESSSTQVAELVSEVAAGAGQQSQSIGQINQAMNEMDKVTQSVAANAEESAAAAPELTAQAETMKGVVHDLTALVDGSKRVKGKALISLDEPVSESPSLLPEL